MAKAIRGWCVLRTAGRNTIPLVETLAEDGFAAWTPVEVREVRKPRSPAKETRAIPMTPSFVFARAEHVMELLALSSAHRKRQPDFSVFHYLGRIPLLAERDLNALRTSEMRTVPKQQRPRCEPGSTIRMTEGAFAGMSGVVETDDGKLALVSFGGRMKVKIDSFILRGNVLGDDDVELAA